MQGLRHSRKRKILYMGVQNVSVLEKRDPSNEGAKVRQKRKRTKERTISGTPTVFREVIAANVMRCMYLSAPISIMK